MDILKTYTKCSVCDGSGVFVTTSNNQPDIIDPCPSCKGAGYHEMGKVDGYDMIIDIQDKLEEIEELIKSLKCYKNK